MKSVIISFQIFLLVSVVLSQVQETNTVTNTSQLITDLDQITKGVDLVKNAFKTLVYGEPQAESYKDLFVDTSKSLVEHLEAGMNIQFELPVDDMLTILVQTIIILVANRRIDLIPIDFNGIIKRNYFAR